MTHILSLTIESMYTIQNKLTSDVLNSLPDQFLHSFPSASYGGQYKKGLLGC